MEPELLRPYLKHYSRDVLLDFRAKMSAALEEKDMDMLHDLDYAFHRYLYEATKRPHIMKLLSYVCDQSQRIRTQDFYQLRRDVYKRQVWTRIWRPEEKNHWPV